MWSEGPCNIRCGFSVVGQQSTKVVVEKHHIFAEVLRWHGVLISGVGDETAFLYPPQIDLVDDVLTLDGV